MCSLVPFAWPDLSTMNALLSSKWESQAFLSLIHLALFISVSAPAHCFSLCPVFAEYLLKPVTQGLMGLHAAADSSAAATFYLGFFFQMSLQFPDTARGGFEACPPVSLFDCLSNKPSLLAAHLSSVIIFAVNRADELGFGYITVCQALFLVLYGY